MHRTTELVTAYGLASLSRAGQYAPGLAARVTRLREPADINLRWGVVRKLRLPRDGALLSIPAHPGATADLSTWGNYLLAAPLNRAAETTYHRHMATTYMIGSVAMVGEQVGQVEGARSFLQPLPEEYVHFLPEDSQSVSHLAVVTRVGPGEFRGAIGTVNESGVRSFQAYETINLGPVPVTPPGLHRV